MMAWSLLSVVVSRRWHLKEKLLLGDLETWGEAVHEKRLT